MPRSSASWMHHCGAAMQWVAATVFALATVSAILQRSLPVAVSLFLLTAATARAAA